MISPAMSTEERLRAATRAAADTVAPRSAPPLRLPGDPAASPLRGGGSRRHRWLRALTPLAAAAAVAAVVIVSLTLTSGVPTLTGWCAEPRPVARRWPASRRTTSASRHGLAAQARASRATATGEVAGHGEARPGPTARSTS